jgi:hypothetical protein
MNFDPNQKGGAFVEEARKLMQDDDDNRPQNEAPVAGGGVKIGRRLGAKKDAKG